MNVRILLVPYDSGHRALRMGRGPLHLIEYGLEYALEKAGHDPEVVAIDSELDPPTETALGFDLARSIAREVRRADADGAFPLVLAGNCFSAVGTVAGLGPERTGVLWFDAHGDLNTPETTRSGFLDGMATATLTGRCWSAMAASVPGFTPIPDTRLALLGARDLDAAEETLLASASIGVADAAALRADPAAAVQSAVRAMAAPERLYVHVDLDVLDPDVARANAFATRGGLRVNDVLRAVEAGAAAAPIGAAALTAFDPAYDEQGRDSAAATEIILGVIERAGAVAAR